LLRLSAIIKSAEAQQHTYSAEAQQHTYSAEAQQRTYILEYLTADEEVD
jgi:hypothetical protein